MKQYHDAMQKIMDQGVDRPDRTGTGTRSLFGMQMRFDLQQGFPAVTTKKLAWKSVVSELLWFLEGSGDENRLREILYGEEDSTKTTIWTQNANADYWKPKAKYVGDLGRVYGVQWRHWQKPAAPGFMGWLKSLVGMVDTVDQIAELMEGLKNDSYGRRHVLTAWNPGELDQMALPPCHMFAQFYVEPMSIDEMKHLSLMNQDASVPTQKLSCQLYQRSCDMFLGVPFNIASYSLMTHMMAQCLGMAVGDFVWTGGDCHIYNNHFDAVKVQLERTEFPLPQLKLNQDIMTIDGFTMADIEMIGYESHGTIKAQMAV
jgi:thymidylate synthase